VGRATAFRAKERQHRQATNDRPRGSRRRGERSTSSSSDDPEPSPTGRACKAGCGRDISGRPPGAKYCENPECALERAASRQRNQRGRDRAHPDLARDRAVRRAIKRGTPARILCRDESHHGFEWADPEGDPFCGLCGRWLGSFTAPNGHDDTDWDMKQFDEGPTGARRHESWTLRPTDGEPPWPARTYFDASLIDDPVREGVVLAA
jgi:hypothetical protein